MDDSLTMIPSCLRLILPYTMSFDPFVRCFTLFGTLVPISFLIRILCFVSLVYESAGDMKSRVWGPVFAQF